MKTCIASLVILSLVAGCARDVQATYPRATPSSGTIEVVLNEPTKWLTVTVNGDLVVDRKHSRRARIDGVPAGIARLAIATGGRCEAGKAIEQEVEVVPDRVTTIALPGPEPNTGCAIFNGLYYVGMNVGILAVAVAIAAAPRHVK